MTLTECITVLKAEFPDKHFNVEVSVWRYHSDKPDEIDIEFSVYDGDEHFKSKKSLRVALKNCITAHRTKKEESQTEKASVEDGAAFTSQAHTLVPVSGSAQASNDDNLPL